MAETLDEQVISTETLSNRLTQAIDANDINLIKDIVLNTHYADLADYINFATHEQRQKIIEAAGDQLDPEILLEFDFDVLNSLRKLFSKKQFSLLVSRLDAQDIVSLIDDFKDGIRTEILSHFPTQKRKAVLKGLSYPKDSAGKLMYDRYISVNKDKTVGEVLEYLIGNEDLPEGSDEIFVVDNKNRPIGSVYISTLIRSKRDEKVKKIMTTKPQLIDSFLDQEEVAYIFRHYNLTSAPVVDKDKKMVGMLLLDQIVEVMNQETEEDIMRSVGVNFTDLYSAFFKTAMKRFPWLFFNLLTACLTSIIVSKFKNQIEQLVILAAIMPIVGSMGGNAGTQSVTVAVRAIANKDLINARTFHLVFKEVAACAMNGLILGILGGFILYLLYGDLSVCGVFALAVTINFILAGLWGGMIPILIDKAGLDPAISSGVLLTFLTDFLGFFIFLSLASLLIL